jgi:DNA-directed RNA polymerase subunit M/transcription elongation factor TFIIS
MQKYVCLKCRKSISVKGIDKIVKTVTSDLEPIYVIEDSMKDVSEVSQTCPRCGKKQALRWLLTFSGEHAGIKQERTVEHYKCVECKNTWTETK